MIAEYPEAMAESWSNESKSHSHWECTSVNWYFYFEIQHY